ncbi:MAG: excinuclease ABC subunit C [Elusimicrobia bacterium CG_4_10_14_0_2_um_filter_56_8]|nr:MAG: excinuclease ABC subunit C [Elusimicrobia bacterium CG_4_10_14_0_2_um_filter_56_8]
MDLSHLPGSPGVYLMRDATGSVLYVGKAKDLRKRVAQYFQKNPSDSRWKIPNLVALIRSIDYIASASEREALLTERQLIHSLQPFFNEMWKDSKTYPYLELTREDFPRLLFTRNKTRDGGRYFGPYPKVEPLKKLTGYLWRIKFINLRRCRWEFSVEDPLPERKIKACLYFHTGQCTAPCAGKISKTAYNALAARVADFLKGDFKKLRLAFKTKMERASRELAYEQAGRYRDFLNAFAHMEERVTVHKLDPEFLQQATGRTGAVTALKTALGLARPPAHIEAFDTSSLFGKQAVGSSVCFINGEKNTPHYRKYRINFKNTPEGGNDLAMMEEIVGRRLAQIKKKEETQPDLLLIDGGPGQLAAAMKALRTAGLKIPVIGLAKRLEEIFMPGRALPLLLDRAHPGLRLLQALRDEAHRFGVTYHRKLRDRIED